MMNSGDYDFSFAGLKTAVRYLVQGMEVVTDTIKRDIARDFEDSCIEVLDRKTMNAAEEYGVRTVIIGGGVSANQKLRQTLKTHLDACAIDFLLPDRGLSTDNALMIALAAHIHPRASVTPSVIKAKGHWRIHETENISAS